PPTLPDLATADGREVTLIAHVTREAPPRSRAAEAANAFDVEIECLQLEDGPPQPMSLGARVTVYSREPSEEDDTAAALAETHFKYGERLRLTGKLHLPRNFGNPGAFDYRQYLAERGIRALIAVRSDRAEKLPGLAGAGAGRVRSRIRRALLLKIHQL